MAKLPDRLDAYGNAARLWAAGDPPQLEHAAVLATRAAPAIEAKGNPAMFDRDATDALEDFSKPLLVIGGDVDLVTKLEARVAIGDQTPKATLLIAEGANQMGPLEGAESYNASISACAFRRRRQLTDVETLTPNLRNAGRGPKRPASAAILPVSEFRSVD